MEPSPLTQDVRPDSFQPKIVQLYKHILLHDDEVYLPSEGIWREFFLLRPDKDGLIAVIDTISPDDLLHFQISSQTLFSRSIQEAAGPSPQNVHAYETLTAFLSGVLSKRYTNPSSDVIEVLAGLNEVDKVMGGLVSRIDATIKGNGNGQVKRAAVNAAIAMTAGAYQTGLVSYFTHRDLFPALMRFMHEAEDQHGCFGPFLLLGLLANYNKYEMQNPYQLRLDDFVNEGTIQQVVRGVGSSAAIARNQYVAVQDDLPEGWTLSSTLVFLGLRALAPEAKTIPPTEDEAKQMFNELPDANASILLPTYSFVNANKVFASNLATLPAASKSTETPFSSFLSLVSYISHHAHRSERCMHNSLLGLLTLRIITEDNVIMKRLSSSDHKIAIRLCRQRSPHLPFINDSRSPLSAILDIATTTLSHNLRKRLDIPLYSLSLAIILRILTFLSRNKIRLSHHWSYIWGSLLSLLRFLTQYSSSLSLDPSITNDICDPLTDIVAFCLSSGDTFLPHPTDYDDLFYKLIETGPILPKFQTSYNLSSTTSSISTLIKVSDHYHNILSSTSTPNKKSHQSPTAVAAVIKQSHETLDISSMSAENKGADFGHWDPWREVGEKALMKRIVRTVVEDGRRWVAREKVV